MRIVGGSPVLRNVSFYRNRADSWGGGVFVEETSSAFTNVAFYANESGRGGGMYSFADAEVLITNATFSGNSATVDGGGLRNTQNSSVRLVNSILWGNTAGDGNEIAGQGDAVTELLHCLYGAAQGDVVEGGSFTATSSLTEDPLFVNAGDGDVRLAADSPAIDAGSPDTDLGTFPTDGSGDSVDLDGNPRVLNGRIDMGAFEGPG